MKKVFVFTMVFLLSFVSNAFAHTGLDSSSPQNGDVVQDELKQVTLTFESKIEQGSSFTLSKSTGEVVAIDNILVEDNVVKGEVVNPLDNGNYNVTWSIIGADGHPVQGELSFTVDVPNETIEEVPEVPVETESQATIEQQNDETSTNTSPEQEKSTPSMTTPIIIVILIVLVAISFWFTRRKK